MEYALSNYNSISANFLSKPLWAVAENYRFEPAFVEVFVCRVLSFFLFSFFFFSFTYIPYFGNMLVIALQSKNLIADIGDMMSVQVIVEGSMNSSNPYFSSSWRRDFTVSVFLINHLNTILSYSTCRFPFPHQIMIVMSNILPWENMVPRMIRIGVPNNNSSTFIVWKLG